MIILTKAELDAIRADAQQAHDTCDPRSHAFEVGAATLKLLDAYAEAMSNLGVTLSMIADEVLT